MRERDVTGDHKCRTRVTFPGYFLSEQKSPEKSKKLIEASKVILKQTYTSSIKTIYFCLSEKEKSMVNFQTPNRFRFSNRTHVYLQLGIEMNVESFISENRYLRPS